MRLGCVFDFLQLVLHQKWEPGSWKLAVTDPPWLFWADNGRGCGLAFWDSHSWGHGSESTVICHLAIVCLYIQSPKTNHLIITPTEVQGGLEGTGKHPTPTKRTEPMRSAKDVDATRAWTVQTPCIRQLCCRDKHHRLRAPTAETCRLSVWRLEVWNPGWLLPRLWGGVCPRPVPWLLGAQLLHGLEILPCSYCLRVVIPLCLPLCPNFPFPQRRESQWINPSPHGRIFTWSSVKALFLNKVTGNGD